MDCYFFWSKKLWKNVFWKTKINFFKNVFSFSKRNTNPHRETHLSKISSYWATLWHTFGTSMKQPSTKVQKACFWWILLQLTYTLCRGIPDGDTWHIWADITAFLALNLYLICNWSTVKLPVVFVLLRCFSLSVATDTMKGSFGSLICKNVTAEVFLLKMVQTRVLKRQMSIVTKFNLKKVCTVYEDSWTEWPWTHFWN